MGASHLCWRCDTEPGEHRIDGRLYGIEPRRSVETLTDCQPPSAVFMFEANQTSLVVKGIAGLGSMAEMAGLLGDQRKRKHYRVRVPSTHSKAVVC